MEDDVKELSKFKSKFAAVMVAGAGLVGMANMSAVQAQLLPNLLPNSPIRLQIGNGPALLGSNQPNSSIGISILSNQVGAANDAGTSIRLLGDNKTAGVYTTLLKTNEPNGTNLQLRTPLDALTGRLAK